MNDGEIARLIDWLKDHGHSDAEIVECLHFIASGRAK